MDKLKGNSNQRQLFKIRIVPAGAGSKELFEEEFVANNGPVECLSGCWTFENDEERFWCKVQSSMLGGGK